MTTLLELDLLRVPQQYGIWAAIEASAAIAKKLGFAGLTEKLPGT